MPKQNFEGGLKRLDEIVRKLEQGDAPLDDALKLFDEGTKLVGACNKLLDTAEQKVALILKGADGKPAETEFNEQ
jgi:exodeoxyribonuclease VII small subunit